MLPKHYLSSGELLSRSHLTLEKWLILLYWWARQYPVTGAFQEVQVSKHSAIQAYQWFRDVCSTWLLAQPIRLGRPGVVVQIDESLYRHKPKASDFTAKCNVYVLISLKYQDTLQRAIQFLFSIVLLWKGYTNQIWVFGMVDTSHTPALGYTQLIP